MKKMIPALGGVLFGMVLLLPLVHCSPAALDTVLSFPVSLPLLPLLLPSA